MKLIVGTRGSALAIAQTDIVIKKLKEQYPNLEIEKKIIITKGDREKELALDKIGDKGLFVSEIERQLLNKNIDFAVHSYKDMPSEIDKKLMIVKTPDRDDPRDVLIVNPKHKINNTDINEWIEKNENICIATGSKRRSCQILKINPNIKIKGIRGNIDTRIEKMIENDLDGIILAASGLNRLKKDNLNIYHFSYEDMIPSPAQGALAVEIRRDRKELIEIFDMIADEEENIKVIAERSFMKKINGGCHSPVGAIATIEGETLTLKGIFGDTDCKNIVCEEVNGSKENAAKLGEELAINLLSKLNLKGV